MFLKCFVTILLIRCGLCAFKSSKITFRSVHCVASIKFVHKNISCTKLDAGRSLATRIYFKIPMNELFVSPNLRKLNVFHFISEQVEATLWFKSGSVFREIKSLPPIEVCEMIRAGTSNIFYRQLLKVLEEGEEFTHVLIM